MKTYMTSPIGLPLFCNQHLFKLIQDQTGLSRLVMGLTIKYFHLGSMAASLIKYDLNIIFLPFLQYFYSISNLTPLFNFKLFPDTKFLSQLFNLYFSSFSFIFFYFLFFYMEGFHIFQDHWGKGGFFTLLDLPFFLTTRLTQDFGLSWLFKQTNLHEDYGRMDKKESQFLKFLPGKDKSQGAQTRFTHHRRLATKR